MTYGEAMHGEWCHATTWRARCRYCQREVFYFTCDHGCKVFFDRLGPPWPLHECREYLATVVGREQLERYMRRTGSYDPADRATSLRLDAVYGERMARSAKRPTFQTVRVEAAPEAQASGLGVVRHMQPCSDVAAWLGAATAGTLGLALMGELARGVWCQVTVVTGDVSAADLKSYTGLVKAKWAQAIGPGDLVVFQASAFVCPGLRATWVFDDLSAVMA